MPTDALVLQSDAPDRWEKALYAFLAEKERRSGSVRSVQLIGQCGALPRSQASQGPSPLYSCSQQTRWPA